MESEKIFTFKCSSNGCNASFKKRCLLDIHLRKHSGERPFICDVPDCQKSYTNVSHLRRHVGLAHEKEDEVMCDIEGCGIVVSSRYNLKKHKIRSHNESTSLFPCSECPQRFRKRWQLNQHSKLHSGEPPSFMCTRCNVGFYQFHKYSKHLKGHKTFTCDCGKEFGKWTIFCEHRRNSCTVKKADNKCIICNKVFTTKNNLTQHSLMVHLEESQNHIYHCSYSGCNRSYKYKKNLTAHISNRHEKEVLPLLPVKCTEAGCGKMFKTQRILRRHLINVHQGANKATIKKERRPRKDKGKHKKCMASILSGVKLSTKENLTIINKHANSVASSSSQTKLENSIENNSKDISEANKEDTLSEVVPTYQEKSNNDSFQAVASDGLDSEDNLLQLCNDMMRKIQECMEQTPIQAQQESMAYCEILA